MGIAAAPLYGVTAGESFHGRYLALCDGIERRFPVARWRFGDVDIWPLARMDLYLDMYWQQAGTRPRPALFPRRLAAQLLRPATNAWRSRNDRGHRVVHPKPADAIFLGDGVSLDRVDGAWRDRFGEPVMQALEKRGAETFLMQSGNLTRLPWHRPTYAANLAGARGWLASLASRGPCEFPALDDVARFVALHDIAAPSIDARALARRAKVVAATADAFERLIEEVRPKLAFVVTYYAHHGHAFVLACRRQGVLSVDLQHDPQAGAHEAYGWSAPPPHGYRTLPAVFWNWNEDDARSIRHWSDRLSEPWHQSIHGGHTQLMRYLNDEDPATRAFDRSFRILSGGIKAEREILVALQPIAGFRHVWEALARAIETAPPGWRWWIRRHPASLPQQDAEFGRLLELRSPKVMIDEASSLPLPALLRHMDVVLSLSSGAAAEAAMFGVRSIFLSEEARASLGHLIARGQASVVAAADVVRAIGMLSPSRNRREDAPPPDLDVTLTRLQDMAKDYAALCRCEQWGGT